MLTSSAPNSSRYAAHDHPPHFSRLDRDPDAPPGALPADLPGPTDSLPAATLNELHAAARQARENRLAAESRGFDSVFAQ